jgi:hypothetical protein
MVRVRLEVERVDGAAEQRACADEVEHPGVPALLAQLVEPVRADELVPEVEWAVDTCARRDHAELRTAERPGIGARSG